MFIKTGWKVKRVVILSKFHIMPMALDIMKFQILDTEGHICSKFRLPLIQDANKVREAVQADPVLKQIWTA